MSKTERAKYVFTVKESANGTPWIMLEPLDKSIKFPGDGFLGFDLPKETSMEEAESIAKYMNTHLLELSFTSFNS